MSDSSANTVVEMTHNSHSQYWRYRFSKRLSYWKTKQDLLLKNITKCKEHIATYKKEIGRYEEKLFEYESYMIALNPVGEKIGQVRADAANRLQDAIQEAGEDESDDESVMSNDDTDAQSVATCNTVLEMREQVARRTGRR
jgi:hypothetical protein